MSSGRRLEPSKILAQRSTSCKNPHVSHRQSKLLQGIKWDYTTALIKRVLGLGFTQSTAAAGNSLPSRFKCTELLPQHDLSYHNMFTYLTESVFLQSCERPQLDSILIVSTDVAFGQACHNLMKP